MNGSVEKIPGERGKPSPVTVADQYALNLFAGIYQLCFYLERLHQLGGESLQDYFKRYSFLEKYLLQAYSVMPAGLDWHDGLVWWRENLSQIEEDDSMQFPLKALRVELELSFAARMALMLAGLVEEDSRFGTLYSYMQQPLGYRRPMLETLGNIVGDENGPLRQSPWEICGPLIDSGLLQVENNLLPRAEWILKVNAQIWDLIKGETNPRERRRWQYITREQLTPIDSLVLAEDMRAKIEALPELLRADTLRTIIIRAQEGSHSVEILGAVARCMDKNLLVVEPPDADDAKDVESLGILCTVLSAIPVFKLELAPGETMAHPQLNGYHGPRGIVLGEEGGLDGKDTERVISVSLPNPGPDLRARMWQQSLGDHQIDDLPLISRQFRLPGDYIRQISRDAVNISALEKRDLVNINDIRVANRNLNRQKLDSLSDPIEATGSWSQLISTESTAEKLGELQQRCCYREQLLDHLGAAFKSSSNCGVRALFTGRSGTGKTLAARILAAELGMDIYRADLASIVNKYIGETEKNLQKIFTRAEALDVILLLDEGEVLLGSRTDIKSSNDRYANLETNYLLQRLEHYQGIVLITTNLSDNIDKAFQRRMDIVIPFLQPQAEQRLLIFNLHLPEGHRVAQDFLMKVAKYCSLMGGQIRNVCLHASLVALDEQAVVANRHLEYALRSEYRKNGGTFPLDVSSSQTESDGGMGNFANALAQGR